MWLKWLKIIALGIFCFYPWWLVSISIHPWYGPIAALIFTFIVILFLNERPDLILLSLLKARERRKAQAQIASDLLKKIAFKYRVQTPRLYFTYKGTRNIYVLYRSKRRCTVVVHEEALTHLTASELEAVFAWLLSPQIKSMLKKGTFYNALTSFGILPLASLIWFLNSLKFLPEKWIDGPKSSIEVLMLAIIEFTHSAFYDRNLVAKNDQKIGKNGAYGTNLISALGKLEQEQKAFSWSEKILLSNRFSQTGYQVRIFSILNEYTDSEFRIEGLKVINNP